MGVALMSRKCWRAGLAVLAPADVVLEAGSGGGGGRAGDAATGSEAAAGAVVAAVAGGGAAERADRPDGWNGGAMTSSPRTRSRAAASRNRWRWRRGKVMSRKPVTGWKTAETMTI